MYCLQLKTIFLHLNVQWSHQQVFKNGQNKDCLNLHLSIGWTKLFRLKLFWGTIQLLKYMQFPILPLDGRVDEPWNEQWRPVTLTTKKVKDNTQNMIKCQFDIGNKNRKGQK